jgi:hypothetical protein
MAFDVAARRYLIRLVLSRGVSNLDQLLNDRRCASIRAQQRGRYQGQAGLADVVTRRSRIYGDYPYPVGRKWKYSLFFSACPDLLVCT